jgi:predicted secreted hydrolase
VRARPSRLALIAGLILTALGLAACAPPAEPPSGGVALGEALGGAAEAGFARAEAPREFVFPRDHGPHPGYRNEWWYVTGNLDDTQGRRYGFQITFFRIALGPERAARASRWGTNQVWMAHLALTDAAGERHFARERFERGALDLAGARAEPFAVWLGDWRLAADPDDATLWRLQAEADGFALDLELRALKEPVLQGEAGLSQKGSEPGNASYYYSMTRLAAGGVLRIGEQARTVTGLAWLDREWSTSALDADQVGWDWFALQFEDGSELMYYQMRRADGALDPHSRGLRVASDGGSRPLMPTDVRIEVERHWTSPLGITYPTAWTLYLPGEGRSLRVRPVLEAQEMDLSVRYWEGAVDVLDTADRLIGRGYVELAGYDAPADEPPQEAAPAGR